MPRKPSNRCFRPFGPITAVRKSRRIIERAEEASKTEKRSAATNSEEKKKKTKKGKHTPRGTSSNRLPPQAAAVLRANSLLWRRPRTTAPRSEKTTASPHSLFTRRPTGGNPTAPWTLGDHGAGALSTHPPTYWRATTVDGIC